MFELLQLPSSPWQDSAEHMQELPGWLIPASVPNKVN